MTAPPECAGPVAIPADLLGRLHRLAVAARTEDFVGLSIGATVLAQRLSRLGSTRRVRVVQGHREATTPVPADLDGSFRAALCRAGELRKAPAPAETTDQRVDVTIVVSQDGTCLYAESMVSSADAPSALCWARTFVQLLTGLARDPDARMATLPLIDAAERERILHGLNRYQRPEIRHRTMAEPFEEQAERTPDAVALLDESGTAVGYRELNTRANRLAHFLIRQGVGPGTRVGICLRRGIHQIVAIYAAVKTGATYVPLDTELPDARLAYILDDTAPTHILTDAAGRNRIPGGSWHLVDAEREHDDCAATNPIVATSPAGLLHILYTSGTTGRPKGVAYPTAGALANLAYMQARYPFEPDDCALFKTSAAFDVSIWEIFWPLYHGACLVICRDGEHRDPRHLARLVESHPVSIIFLPPTVMSPFLEQISAERTRLRWTLCGGEPVTPRIRDTFYATLPGTTLLNCYGPTEANSVTDMPLPDEPGTPVPLGRPATNFRIRILDEDLEPVPVGMPGEAYIGGEIGVAHAYWRAPGRTAERFVPDPYGPPGSRMYRTGDLCRYRMDGVLEHLGRIDRQIKIRGLRIEPGEIESVLASHPAVADCAVIAHDTPVRLLAFVVPAAGTAVDDLDLGAIERFAARFLPGHMRPEQLVPMPRILTDVNGKIDNRALVAAGQDRADREHGFVPPADDLEAAVVDIYRRVLGTDPVSVLDTFTQLGGNSMLAFILFDECLQTLGAQPGPAELLTGTVREVAAAIRHARFSAAPAGSSPDASMG
ncbi:non-ribosomal peptide synthetase [Pseudonocardia xinjiangensis]|uniref:Non-ribosomal peptide synthetase n=1 Tax=Pseudonocardia xinjiangensis TaxID=75289 RepID=A0ABX1R6X6_9PSEU|nr:amino acid adenylation domain-containing protein [Pseudonocardia xinjiangensis]NMH76157.1 non-ribosomal peptide synthetase [Pseudonocardia xinjiangensis]